jgi:hypothetical protein
MLAFCHYQPRLPSKEAQPELSADDVGHFKNREIEICARLMTPVEEQSIKYCKYNPSLAYVVLI